MNELSWLIYLADTAGSVDAYAQVIGTGAFAFGIYKILNERRRHEDNSHRADAKAWDFAMADHIRYPSLYKRPASDRPRVTDTAPKFGKAIRVPVAIISACVLVSVVTPGRDTMYAIAASQMGEKVLQSATFNKATQALNSWLDKQIAGQK